MHGGNIQTLSKKCLGEHPAIFSLRGNSYSHCATVPPPCNKCLHKSTVCLGCVLIAHLKRIIFGCLVEDLHLQRGKVNISLQNDSNKPKQLQWHFTALTIFLQLQTKGGAGDGVEWSKWAVGCEGWKKGMWLIIFLLRSTLGWVHPEGEDVEKVKHANILKNNVLISVTGEKKKKREEKT